MREGSVIFLQEHSGFRSGGSSWGENDEKHTYLFLTFLNLPCIYSTVYTTFITFQCKKVSDGRNME